jgi:hypothetical protein
MSRGDGDDVAEWLHTIVCDDPDAIVTTLRVGMDEAGTHDQLTICVAACLGTVDQWQRFAQAWVPTCPPHYHAKRASDETNFALAKLAQRHLTLSMATTLNEQDYRQCAPHRFQSLHGRAYTIAVTWSAVRLAYWAQERLGVTRIAYVIEAGAHGDGHVDQIFRRILASRRLRNFYRVRSQTWVSKHDNEIVVHPADLISHEFAMHDPNGATLAYNKLSGFVEHYDMDQKMIAETVRRVEEAERQYKRQLAVERRQNKRRLG